MVFLPPGARVLRSRPRTALKHRLLLHAFLTLIPLGAHASPAATSADFAASEGQAPSVEQPNLDRLVDIGGRRLHLKCGGTGSPTVILEAGLGSYSKTWDKVMPEVSRLTRVCSYDRAYEGLSDPAPRTIRVIGSRRYIELRTGQEVVEDLHALLTKAGVSGPYVVVGHSLGGLYAILYAGQHPKDVVGMVLVDSAHEDQVAREEALMTPEQARHDREGLEQNEEGVDIDEVFAEVRAAHWHGDIPLYVLVHGRQRPPSGDRSAEQMAKMAEVWRDLQADSARRSPNSRLVVAEKSGHGIQNDQPALVIDAIAQVLKSCRSVP